MDVILAQNLIKDYNGLRAVNSIDFTIQQGECFGFLGPNGAGKTTVMRIISCFMPPTSGTVTVFGDGRYQRAKQHQSPSRDHAAGREPGP